MSLSVGMESSSSYRPIAQAFLSFVRPITWLVSVFPCDAHKKHLAGSTQVATLCPFASQRRQLSLLSGIWNLDTMCKDSRHLQHPAGPSLSLT